MKILAINGRLEGAGRYGLARVASELTRELVEQGHEVRTLAYDVEPRPHPFTGYNEHIHSVLLGLEAVERLTDLWQQEGPFDSVLAWDWAAGLMGSVARRLYRAPLVAWMHGTEIGRRIGRLSAEDHYAAEMERWLCERANRVFVPSEFAKRDIVDHYDVPTTKVEVLGIGARRETFDVDVDIADFRAMFAEPGRPLVLFAGELTPSKGADTLLDAVPMVLDRMPNARFVVAGDGMQQAEISKRTTPSVRLTGALTEPVLGALYRSADVLVVPSRYEASGISVLEAQLHGLPVVATEAGALGQLPDSFFAAPRVRWENPFALAHAIADGCKRGRTEPDDVPGDFQWPVIAKRAARLLAV